MCIFYSIYYSKQRQFNNHVDMLTSQGGLDSQVKWEYCLKPLNLDHIIQNMFIPIYSFGFEKPPTIPITCLLRNKFQQPRQPCPILAWQIL